MAIYYFKVQVFDILLSLKEENSSAAKAVRAA
jgi:hypothetical protein